MIDGVGARVLGLDPAWVRARPSQLALFPESDGVIELQIELPPQFPAGTHTVTVEVTSTVDPAATEHRDVAIVVEPSTDAVITLEPAAVTAAARARYEVVCENRGNTPVGFAFTAADPERALRFEFSPPVLDVPPGGEARAVLVARGRRRLAGGEVTRPVEVVGVGGERQIVALGTFTQKPVVPRGVLTSGVLAAIVLLWALVFVFAMDRILDGEPMAKAAPPEFYLAAINAAEADGTEVAGGAGESAGGRGAARGELDPRAVGGSISGTVTAASTGEAVGRITVEAVRDGRNGPQIMSAAATTEDGSYVIGGLFPGRYKLRFTAPGFEEVWYPAAPGRDTAEEVRVRATAELDDIDAVVTGAPGAITGRVDTGDTGAPPPVTVVVRSVVGSVRGSVVATTTTDAGGSFSVPGLPTPGSYELAFSADQFEPQAVVERLDGGQQLVTNTVRLSAGPGTIGGIVTEGGLGLGGVQVTAVSGDIEVASATPTSGSVGRYLLGDLPTPGTYLLTFVKDGYGSETIAVDLGPGEQLLGLDIALQGGTGTISGTVSSSVGGDLGDVTVTVRGGAVEVVTTSVTAGDVGSYLASGLPTPGEYTVTFAKPGYASETRAVDLRTSGFASGIDVVLRPTLAAVRGTVSSSSGATLAGVAVTLTDGGPPRETQSAADPPGGFALTALAPGSYSVTFAIAGHEPRTVLVRLDPGQQATLDVVLPVLGSP